MVGHRAPNVTRVREWFLERLRLFRKGRRKVNRAFATEGACLDFLWNS
jgi:hypothetical protein